MKNRLKLAVTLACAAFIAAPGAANAQSEWSDKLDNVYVKILGGASFMGDTDGTQNGIAGAGATGDGSYDTGFVAGAAVGYEINDRFSAELEWDYRTNGLDQYKFSDGTNFNEGDLSSNIIFLNGFYHFQPVASSKLRPYVGAGLGYVQEIDIDLQPAGGSETSYEGDANFAYQFMAGAQYALNDNWSINSELRYTRVDSIEFKQEDGSAKLNDIDYDPVTVMAGVSYHF